MSELERVLELVLEGASSPEEIAGKLGISVDKVEAALTILESLGYIERVQFGDNSCESCPLRRVCGGRCVRPASRLKAYVPKFSVGGGDEKD